MAQLTYQEIFDSFSDTFSETIKGEDVQNWLSNMAAWNIVTVDGTKPGQAIVAGARSIIDQWTHDTVVGPGEVLMVDDITTAPFGKSLDPGYSGDILVDISADLVLNSSNGIYTMEVLVNGLVRSSVTFETSAAVSPYHLDWRAATTKLGPGDVVTLGVTASNNETFKIDGGVLSFRRSA